MELSVGGAGHDGYYPDRDARKAGPGLEYGHPLCTEARRVGGVLLVAPDNGFTRVKQQGRTLLMVEQNAARALELSDRGYALELGHNRFTDTGARLLANEDVRRMYLGGA